MHRRQAVQGKARVHYRREGWGNAVACGHSQKTELRCTSDIDEVTCLMCAADLQRMESFKDRIERMRMGEHHDRAV